MKFSAQDSRACRLFDNAVAVVKKLGFYDDDVAWQSSRNIAELTEEALLRENAYVILNSGFRNSVALKLWPKIYEAFFYFESAEVVLFHREDCVRDALKVLNHRGKIKAMAVAAEIIHKGGFQALKGKIIADPIKTLLQFPYIGNITVYHLAKAIGVNVAKPDRHLVRIASAYGYQDVQAFCRMLSGYSGLSISCVDLLLWHWAANNLAEEKVLTRGGLSI